MRFFLSLKQIYPLQKLASSTTFLTENLENSNFGTCKSKFFPAMVGKQQPEKSFSLGKYQAGKVQGTEIWFPFIKATSVFLLKHYTQ